MPRLQLTWDVRKGPKGEQCLYSVDHSQLRDSIGHWWWLRFFKMGVFSSANSMEFPTQKIRTSLKLKALLCKLPETLSWTWDVSSPSLVTSQSPGFSSLRSHPSVPGHKPCSSFRRGGTFTDDCGQVLMVVLRGFVRFRHIYVFLLRYLGISGFRIPWWFWE